MTKRTGFPTIIVKGGESMEDEEIIELFFLRSEQAVAEAQKKYSAEMQRFAGRFLSSPEDCEECVNEALFKAWRSVPPTRPENLRAFLLHLTRCTALNIVDRLYAGKRTAELVSLSRELEECIPDSRQDKDAEESRLSELINGFLSELPKEKRAVFVKRYWQGLTIAEIAKETGFGESKIKTMLMRTRKKLKEYMERHGEDHERK